MKANLCLHAGGALATWEQVKNVATPPAIGRHSPVSHAALVERIERFLTVDGFTVTERQCALAKDGARFFGLFQLAHPSLFATDRAYVLGVRNAHDKSFAASVCAGVAPFVCDNLAFSPGADGIVVRRRHTGAVQSDLNSLVGEMIANLAGRFQISDNRVAHYQGATLDRRDSDHLIMELWRNGVILPTDIRRVWEEYNGKTEDDGRVAYRHEEFSPRTAYSLFNALTQVLKGIDKEGNANPDLWTLPKTTADAYTLFDRVLGFDPNKSVIDIAPENA